jgi:hypothetical protein
LIVKCGLVVFTLIVFKVVIRKDINDWAFMLVIIVNVVMGDTFNNKIDHFKPLD